jgi:hypothetical protein
LQPTTPSHYHETLSLNRTLTHNHSWPWSCADPRFVAVPNALGTVSSRGTTNSGFARNTRSRAEVVVLLRAGQARKRRSSTKHTTLTSGGIAMRACERPRSLPISLTCPDVGSAEIGSCAGRLLSGRDSTEAGLTYSIYWGRGA